ncbi:hypothetical protein D9613_002353 [Agrocybe pediades]|uniref:Uncharacterized protein n=1 Tax=Agrocybe pediades TaxID=84607 RepID=A0A8H4R439_9AGAR|nr:hypothetical protein D9613_002353 [Agrocybe pediades]
MSTLEIVVLNAPEIPELKALANSTSQSLKVLRPWCKAEHTSIALRSIKLQAQTYTKAIDFSIIAAEQGHTIAEEALGFAENIDHVSFSEDQRQAYLRQMLEMAYKGESNAHKAHEKFREVRTTLERLIKDAREEHELQNAVLAQSEDAWPMSLSSSGLYSLDHSKDANELNKLESGVTVLEEFSRCVSLFISWWNKMKMSQASLAARAHHVFVNYNALRERSVVQKWEQLKQSYVEYCDEIKRLQDADEEFAEELAQARLEAGESNPQRVDHPTTEMPEKLVAGVIEPSEDEPNMGTHSNSPVNVPEGDDHVETPIQDPVEPQSPTNPPGSVDVEQPEDSNETESPQAGNAEQPGHPPLPSDSESPLSDGTGIQGPSGSLPPAPVLIPIISKPPSPTPPEKRPRSSASSEKGKKTEKLPEEEVKLSLDAPKAPYRSSSHRQSLTTMPVTEIVLDAPVIPECLQALANWTNRSLKVLQPWRKVEHTSGALISIELQAQTYIKAVDFSIVAAEKGHTIAQEALDFANSIDRTDFSEDDRQRYLSQMLKMAQDGRQNAIAAHERFRDVRKTLLRLISEARQENAGQADNVEKLNKLEDDLIILEEFSRCVSLFITWWNEMRMGQSSLADRAESVRIDYNTLRDSAVVQNWKKLKRSYVEYCDQIKAYRDHQEIATETARAQRQAEETDSRYGDSTVSRSRVIAPNFNDLRERFYVDLDSPIRDSQPNAASNTLEDSVIHTIASNLNDLHEEVDANSTIRGCLPDSAASHTPEDSVVHDVAPDMNVLHEEIHSDSPIRDSPPNSAAPTTTEGPMPVPHFYDLHEESRVDAESMFRDYLLDSTAPTTPVDPVVRDIAPNVNDLHEEIHADSPTRNSQPDSSAPNTPEGPVPVPHFYDVHEKIHADSPVCYSRPDSAASNTQEEPAVHAIAPNSHESHKEIDADSTIRDCLPDSAASNAPEDPVVHDITPNSYELHEGIRFDSTNQTPTQHDDNAIHITPPLIFGTNTESLVEEIQFRVPVLALKKSGQVTTAVELGSAPIQTPMEEQSAINKAPLERIISIALRSIKVQAQTYTKAINFSIVAAQLGHVIAEQAFIFAKSIDHTDFLEEYRQRYLRQMLDMAYRGEKLAQKAHVKFRDVRTTLERLIGDAREEQNPKNAVLAHNSTELSKLEDDIAVLEQFSQCLSMFISWWSGMKMSRPLAAPIGYYAWGVMINYESLREKSVVQTWEPLMHSHEKYCIEIEHIAHTDEHFTTEILQIWREMARESEDEDIHPDSLAHVSKPSEMPMMMSDRLPDDIVAKIFSTSFGSTLDELETHVDRQERARRIVQGWAVRPTHAQKQKQSQTVKSPTRTEESEEGPSSSASTGKGKKNDEENTEPVEPSGWSSCIIS